MPFSCKSVVAGFHGWRKISFGCTTQIQIVLSPLLLTSALCIHNFVNGLVVVIVVVVAVIAAFDSALNLKKVEVLFANYSAITPTNCKQV